jgi:hypothetical protein
VKAAQFSAASARVDHNAPATRRHTRYAPQSVSKPPERIP